VRQFHPRFILGVIEEDCGFRLAGAVGSIPTTVVGVLMALLLNAKWKFSYTALKKKSQNKEKGMNKKRCLKAAMEYTVPRCNWATTVLTVTWLVHLAT
jgi:hypothetical protein